MKIGIYRLREIGGEELKNIEKLYQTKVNIVSVYRAWNNCRISDDSEWLKQLKNVSRDIMITWEPWKIPSQTSNSQINQPEFSLKEIISGKYEKYIRDFAAALKKFHTNIYLRPMHEMNGNWYPWCGTVNNNKPEDYLKAWHYIRNIVNEEITGIKWVWSIYAKSFPDDCYNEIKKYFPGDDTVNFTAIDGYNWGTSKKNTKWQTFEEIFKESYFKIISLSNQPIMIAETACSEIGGKKEQWIGDASNALRSIFQKVEFLIWFDINKEQDWRIESSHGSMQAFKLFTS